jgi:hypothetical protein
VLVVLVQSLVHYYVSSAVLLHPPHGCWVLVSFLVAPLACLAAAIESGLGHQHLTAGSLGAALLLV